MPISSLPLAAWCCASSTRWPGRAWPSTPSPPPMVSFGAASPAGFWRPIAALAEGVAEEGMEVLLRGLPLADGTDVVKELLEAKGLLVGSSTHNQRILLNIAAFMEDLKGLRFSHKLGAAFGSHGWAGGAVGQLEEDLREAGFDVMPSELAVRWAPSEKDLARAREFGRGFAREVRRALAEPVAAHHGTEA